MLIFLGFTVCDCAKAASSDESYAVYSAILKGITKSPEGGQAIELLVIGDSTVRTDGEIEELGKKILNQAKASLSKPFQNAISDYSEKSKKEQRLTRSFDLKTKYELINKADFYASFKVDNLEQGWENFYRKYPKSPGFIVFSNVGFDAEKKHAILYREIHCGSLCADGSFVLLENTNSEWKVAKTIPIWAS